MTCEKHNFELVWKLDNILNFRCRNCPTSCGVSKKHLYVTLTGGVLEFPMQFAMMTSENRPGGYLKGNRRKDERAWIQH